MFSQTKGWGLWLSAAASYFGIAQASSCNLSAPYDNLDAENFVVAAVRQPPVNFALPIGLNKTWVDLDLNATVAQAIETVQQAKDDNVAFVAFPELYFPGYPVVSTCVLKRSHARIPSNLCSGNQHCIHSIPDCSIRQPVHVHR
jgi:hypothetical protein